MTHSPRANSLHDASLFMDPSLRRPYDSRRYEDSDDEMLDTSLDISFSNEILPESLQTIGDESEPEDLKHVASPRSCAGEGHLDEGNSVSDSIASGTNSIVSETPRPGRIHSLNVTKPPPIQFPKDAPVKQITISHSQKKIQDDWFVDFHPPKATVGLWDGQRLPKIDRINVTPSNLLIPDSILVESLATRCLGTFLKGLSLGTSRIKRQVGYLIGHLRVVQKDNDVDSQLVLWINRFDPGTWIQSCNGLHLSPTMLDEDDVSVAVWDSQDDVVGTDGDATSLGQYHVILTKQGLSLSMRFSATCPDMTMILDAIPTPRLVHIPDFTDGTPEWGYIVTSAARSAYLVSHQSRPVLSQQVSPVGVWIQSSGKSDVQSSYTISNRNLRRLVRRAGALAQPHPLLSLLQDRGKPSGTMIVAIADSSLSEFAEFWECKVEESKGVTEAKAVWHVMDTLDGLTLDGQLQWSISMVEKPKQTRVLAEEKVDLDLDHSRPPPLPPQPHSRLTTHLPPAQITSIKVPQSDKNQDAMQLLIHLLSTLAHALKPKAPSMVSIDDCRHEETMSSIDVGDSASQVFKRPETSVIAALVHDDAEQSFVLPLTSHRRACDRRHVTDEADRLAQRYLSSEETIHEGYSLASLDYLKRWNLLK
jgi:hypothetical protein